jgi:hypothetical protein
MNRKSKRVLTWEEVVEARRRYNDPHEYTTVRSLADDYGIGKSSMHRLLTHQTYKEPVEEVN